MGSLPLGGIPPILGNWDFYGKLVDELAAHKLIESPKDLWWDVRPSPSLGTVEVRICDMPLGLEAVLGLTALIECLVHFLSGEDCEADQDIGPEAEETDRVRRMILQQNRWLAARHGLDAELIECFSRHNAPARVLARTDRSLDSCRSRTRLRRILAESPAKNPPTQRRRDPGGNLRADQQPRGCCPADDACRHLGHPAPVALSAAQAKRARRPARGQLVAFRRWPRGIH